MCQHAAISWSHKKSQKQMIGLQQQALACGFGIMGEPIVESPINAIRCFFSTGLDALALGSYLIRKT